MADTTLYDHWRNYMSPIPSPDIFIDVGFYYMISAALQRRVWYGSLDAPVFPNQYVLFVAKAGVGKGEVTGVVDKMLSFHSYVPGKIDPNGVEFRGLETDIEAFDLLGASKDDKLLFPKAANAGSYQAIARKMSQETRTFGVGVEKKIMAQSSLHVILDEFTSLFHEDARNVVDFFLTCWTGTVPYEHETVGRGKDFIKAPCLSMIAGTQPDRLPDLQKLKVITSGLARRLLIVYAEQNRFRALSRIERTVEQKKSRAEIIKYLKVASIASGPVKYSADALAYLDEWYVSGQCTVNKSTHPIVLDYEATKAPHIHKMCMAFHFAERGNWKPGTSLGEMSLETAQRATAFLNKIEMSRHVPFEYQGRSVMAPVAQKVVGMVKASPLTRDEIFAMNFGEFDNVGQCDEVLISLQQAGKLKVKNDRGTIKYTAV